MASFEKFIEDHSFVEDHGWGDLCVSVESLRDFLDGKVIVPRKPTQVQLEAMESVVREECRDPAWAEQQYNLAIEAGENE